MYAIINSTTGQEFPRYFKDANALKEFVISSFGSIENAPAGLQVIELSDSEYQKRVQARGAKENEQMNKNIRSAKEAVMAQEGGIGQYIAPYTRHAELAGKQPGLKEGMQDVASLLGRAAATGMDPDFESMKIPSEQREGIIEKIVTSPVTGGALASIPIAALGGPLIASQIPTAVTTSGIGAYAAPYIAPAITGGIEAAGGVASGFSLSDDYGKKDAAVDVGLSLAIPVLGNVIGRIPKTLAINKIQKIMAKNGAGGAADKYTAEQIYNKITDKPLKNQSERLSELGKESLNTMMKDVPPGMLVADDLVAEARDDVMASLYRGERNFADVDKSINAINDFARKLDMLKKGVDNGDIELPIYRKHMADLISEYSSIPELRDVLEGAARGGWDNIGDKLISFYPKMSESMKESTNKLGKYMTYNLGLGNPQWTVAADNLAGVNAYTKGTSSSAPSMNVKSILSTLIDPKPSLLLDKSISLGSTTTAPILDALDKENGNLNQLKGR